MFIRVCRTAIRAKNIFTRIETNFVTCPGNANELDELTPGQESSYIRKLIVVDFNTSTGTVGKYSALIVDKPAISDGNIRTVMEPNTYSGRRTQDTIGDGDIGAIIE